MSRSYPKLILIAVAFLFSGCGKSPQDEAAGKITKIFDELAGAVSGIRDDASCEEAIPEIQGLIREFQDVTYEAGDLKGHPSATKKKQLDAAVEGFKRAVARMQLQASLEPALKRRLNSNLERLQNSVLVAEGYGGNAPAKIEGGFKRRIDGAWIPQREGASDLEMLVFRSGRMREYVLESVNDQKYSFSSASESTGDFVLEVRKESDRLADELKGTIRDDTLTLEWTGGAATYTRLSEGQFEERREKIRAYHAEVWGRR